MSGMETGSSSKMDNRSDTNLTQSFYRLANPLLARVSEFATIEWE